MPLVSFEGIDGCGKTTQVERLVRWLEGRHAEVLRTKEPDGGRIGPGVRKILTTGELAGRLSPIEELLLISAARYDHVRGIMEPVLDRGGWVVTDRFYDSTFAIQVFETEADPMLFDVVTRAVVGSLKPDLTIILDIPVDEAMARRSGRKGADDPTEAHRNFDRIRRGFLHMVSSEPQRCRRIDALMTPAEIHAEVCFLVEEASEFCRRAAR